MNLSIVDLANAAHKTAATSQDALKTTGEPSASRPIELETMLDEMVNASGGDAMTIETLIAGAEVHRHAHAFRASAYKLLHAVRGNSRSAILPRGLGR